PQQGEIKRCLPDLQAELEYLRDMGCKNSLALGATAYKALGGQASITHHARRPHAWQGFTIVPSIHPAAYALSPHQCTRFKLTVGRFAQVVRGKRVTLPDVEVVVVRDDQGIRQMYEDLKRQAVVAFDIETYGLDEQQEHSDIIGISYCAKPEKAYVVLLN